MSAPVRPEANSQAVPAGAAAGVRKTVWVLVVIVIALYLSLFVRAGLLS